MKVEMENWKNRSDHRKEKMELKQRMGEKSNMLVMGESEKSWKG